MYLCKGILIFKLFKILFMYGCADLPCFRGLSLVSASWGLCVTLSGLLTGGLASLARARALGHMGSVVSAPRLQSTYRLSSCAARA